MDEYLERMYKNSKRHFYNKIEDHITNNKKMFIITANPETLMIAKKNELLNKILLSNIPIIVADGIGIIKAGKMLKMNFKERIPGIEIAIKLLDYSNKYSKRVYFFGATEEVMSGFVKKVQEMYPNIVITGAKNGYDNDKEKTFEEIINISPDIIFLGLGVPKQELLISEYYHKFNKGIFIGVGGTFDVLSGRKKRAPKMFIELNMEWLYRLFKEPWRFKRFFNNNIKFFFKIIFKKISAKNK